MPSDTPRAQSSPVAMPHFESKKEPITMTKSEFMGSIVNDSNSISIKAKRREEVIFPSDQLEIGIYGKLPVSQEKTIEMKRVNEKGTILVVPVGEIQVAGLTISEAQTKIEEGLAAYIKSPFVEVAIAKRGYQPMVYVLGEIMRAGSIPLKHGDRLIDAIAEMGGCKEDAYRRSIHVVRTNASDVSIYTINLQEIMEHGAIQANIELQDQDVVFVPRRFMTNAREVLSFVGVMLPYYYFFKNFY
jgi:polysaccharide biosynthesis/export protein